MSLKTSIQSFINNLNEEYQFKKQKANYVELDDEDDALIIGTSQFGDVAFNKEKLLKDTRCLIAGTSGSGKSYFARNIIECIYNCTFPNVKNVIIQIHDPEGEFFTLREDCQFDFLVFGRGDDCDVELSADNAAELATKTVAHKMNCIIDYTSIPDYDERLLIAATWNETLLEITAKREIRTHLFLFIDEAHKFAPRGNSADPLRLRCKDSLKDLSRTSRKRGIVPFFITQRVTHLHTDIYAEINNFLIGKTVIEADIRRNGELTGIDKPKKQALFKVLKKEFIVNGSSFTHSDDDKFSGEMIKCISNSPASKHGKENFNIDDPLFYDPSLKVKGWISVLKGQKVSPKLKIVETEPKHNIRELRLKKAQQKVLDEKIDQPIWPTDDEDEVNVNEDTGKETPQLKKYPKLELEWESEPLQMSPEEPNDLQFNEKIKVDFNENPVYEEVAEPIKLPTSPVEKSLTDNYNTSSASKIITENTFNVWYHIICFFGSISIQNLYVLSIRDDYNTLSADMEIKLFCKQNKNIFVVRDDLITFLPKNPNDESLKSKLQLSKSEYFIKLWKHKINNIDYEKILTYLFADENYNNSYKDIAKHTKLDIKEIKNFVSIYAKCGLVVEREDCVYLNTIFFHSKIHDGTNAGPESDDPDFDDFEDDEDNDFDDDDFDDESDNDD